MIQKILRNKFTILLAGFFLGIIAVTSVQYVSAHGGNLNLIHACVKNSNGSIRIVGASDTCAAAETALDWTKTPWNSDFPLMCQNCDLSQNLTGSLFNGKDLTNAFLQGSDLSGNDFTNTILTGAHITSVNFSNSNLQGKNLSNQNLKLSPA